MIEVADVLTEACPFLRPGLGASGSTPSAAIYCALPGRRVRVPARDERRVYCDADRYEHCPVYQSHVAPR
jgi:hypothetical protein